MQEHEKETKEGMDDVGGKGVFGEKEQNIHTHKKNSYQHDMTNIQSIGAPLGNLPGDCGTRVGVLR